MDSVTNVVGKLELGRMEGAEPGLPGKLLDPSVIAELAELVKVTVGREEAEVLCNVVVSIGTRVVRELKLGWNAVVDSGLFWKVVKSDKTVVWEVTLVDEVRAEATLL